MHDYAAANRDDALALQFGRKLPTVVIGQP
jgi:hypothetical protein